MNTMRSSSRNSFQDFPNYLKRSQFFNAARERASSGLFDTPRGPDDHLNVRMSVPLFQKDKLIQEQKLVN